MKIKFPLGALAVLCVALAVFWILSSENALLMHPKGLLARKELHLIGINYLLMLIIVIPTFIALFIVAWKYRHQNPKAKYEPESEHRKTSEMMLWIVPSLIIAVMTVITWFAAHELDPYKPLQSKMKPLKIQVVALDWKWLFIYPEQGIATVNFIQFPEKTPIHFELSADGSPMNSFWIPQLSGQIYAMTGMTTQLHIMADEIGTYSGRAAEINGKGFADMIFAVQTCSLQDFNDWVARVKNSSLKLDLDAYRELVQPSIKHPVSLYSYVEKDLFNTIVNQ